MAESRKLIIFVSFFFVFIMLLLSYISSLLLMPLVHKIIQKQKNFLVKKNYRQTEVPLTFGLLFFFNWGIFSVFLGLILIPFLIFLPSHDMRLGWPRFYRGLSQPLVLFGFYSLAALAGFFDDIRAQNDIKGLKNNLSYFVKHRKLTASLGKGLIISFLAIAVSMYKNITVFPSTLTTMMEMLLSDFPRIVLDTLVICLSTNFINLLDLRPGRAIKVFVFFLMICSIPFVHALYRHTFNESVGRGYLIVPGIAVVFLSLAPLLGALTAYAPLDFYGKAMMGDTGSNTLGFVIGVFFIGIQSVSIKVFILFFLIAFHIYCEFYSFSDLVERNRVLRWLDRLGTDRAGDRQ